MTFKSLLPRNRTTVELQLEQTLAIKHSIASLDTDIIRKLHEPSECPLTLLPWLAFALSLDEWDDSWSESVKRQYISDSISIHKHKGTAYAIKTALLALGYKSAIIREAEFDYYNGVRFFNGAIDYGSFTAWPLFDVILNIGYTPAAPLIAEIRARIERYKNERSVLRNLIFMNLFYDNTILYDGTYKYNGGVI